MKEHQVGKAITVRNVPENVHRALKIRAALHGRSTEAEVRKLLEEAVRPKTALKIGSELAAFGRRFSGVRMDVSRSRTPPEPATFE